MGYFNEFPHTRMYDGDLGYLIKMYKELVEEYGSIEEKYELLTKIYEQIKGDIQNVTIEQLQEWLEDGTLKSIFDSLANIYINVKNHGVIGDGVHDDTNAIQECINTYTHCTLFFPSGTYLITKPLDIKCGNDYQINLKLDNNALIKTNTPIEALINIGKTYGSNYIREQYGNIINISGGTWDCTNTTYGIYGTADTKQVRLTELDLINVTQYGIYLDKHKVSETSNSTDWSINTVSIVGQYQYINNYGMYLNASDNEIINLRITGIKNAVVLNSGGNYFNTGHFTYQAPNLTTSQVNQCVGVTFNASNNFFNQIYIDEYGTCFICNFTDGDNWINETMVFYYLDDNNSNFKVVDLRTICYLYMSNCLFNMGDSTGVKKVVDTTQVPNAPTLDDAYNPAKYPALKKATVFNNCRYIGTKLLQEDAFNCMQLNNMLKPYTPIPDPWVNTLQQNQWYRLCLLNSRSTWNLRISVASDETADVTITFVADSAIIDPKNIFSSNIHKNMYQLQMGDTYTNERGEVMGWLYIRALDANSSANVTVDNIAENWNNTIYCSGDLRNPVASPNLISEPATF